MKPIDRLNAILAGEAPDRRPFVPSVYEHGAALLGKTPSVVSRDAGLMAEAAIAAYRTYEHDLVTVGIDIYNIEAEAFGCTIRRDDESCLIPGVVSHPLEGDGMPDPALPAIPQPDGANRLGVIVDAAGRVVDAIGDDVWVYGCMGGPFSQAVELRGFNDFIVDIVTNPSAAHALLARTTQLALEQAERLSRRGAGVYLYESWATIPLITPAIFGTFVVPYNRQVITAIRQGFRTPPPAVVMGGNVSILVDFFVEARSSLVVCDFNADFDLIRSRTAGRRIMVRGCVDPKAIERGGWDDVSGAARVLARKSRGMHNFLWGCGCVSYVTPPQHVLRFKDLCLAADAHA